LAPSGGLDNIFRENREVVSGTFLRVMCPKALAEEAQATEALDALIVHVEQQAEPFRIAWSFSRLRGIVEQSKVEAIVANRKFLLGFLDAASGKSRDEVLAALKRLRQQ